MSDAEFLMQVPEYLAELLPYLACPVDASPLTPVRDEGRRVVALQSASSEYPVSGNVPCLIPNLDPGSDRSQALWLGRQDQMWQNYLDGDRGVFSNDDEVTEYLGEILLRTGRGLFLDVGCGALPLPPYMSASDDQIRWIGIDPFLGDTARQFPFVQAMGEYLPFGDGIFDGALYASTIYHQQDPRRSLEQAWRAVKPGGQLYVWYEPPRLDARYLFWKARQALGWPCPYNRSYRWAFTQRSLHSLLARTGWSVEDEILLCTRCPEYPECPATGEFLVIARR